MQQHLRGDMYLLRVPGFDPRPARLAAALALIAACSEVEGRRPTNQPPILDVPETLLIPEGGAGTFTARATDPDDDIVTLEPVALPSGATFDKDSGVFVWTPGFEAARGEVYVVTISASDGLESIHKSTNVSVLDVNHPPELVVPGTQSVLEGRKLTFSVTASDPDGEDTPTISTVTEDLPAGATFDGHLFTWTPTFEQQGTYPVSFTAVDNHVLSGALTDSKSVEINVLDRPPVPEAPPNLMAVAGEDEVALSWEAAERADDYVLVRGAVSGGPYSVEVTTTTALSHLDKQVVNGTTYSYVVYGRNVHGDGDTSNEAVATPVSTRPPPPTGLTAYAGNTAVSLSWDATEGAVWYVVWRTTAAEGPGEMVGMVQGLSFTDRDLSNSTTYHYRLTYTGAAGESQAAGPVDAVPTADVPLAPVNLRAVPGDGEVGLIWENPQSNPVSSYTVYRAAASGGPYASVAESIKGPSSTDRGLADGQTCFYVVRAFNGSGESANSPEARATTDEALPRSPANVRAVAGNQGLTVFWDRSPDATRYVLYRGTAVGGPYFPAANPRTPSFSETLYISNDTTYRYVVAAVNEAGEGPWSAEAGAEPLETLPRTPSGVRARPGHGQVTLTWEKADLATAYVVHRAAQSGGPYVELTDAAVGPSFTDDGLTDGATYFYRVQGIGDERGAFSHEVRATPSSALPRAPEGLVVTAGSQWVELHWSPVDGAQRYLVYRRESGGELKYGWVTAPAEPSFLDDWNGYGLDNTKDYTYVVSAVGPAGEGAWSAAQTGKPRPSKLPARPTGLTATVGDKKVHLAFWPAVGATSHAVYRSQTQNGPYTTLVAETPNSLSWDYTWHYYSCTDDTVANGTPYYYVARALGTGGENDSQEVTATATAAAPPPPTNLQVLAGASQVTVRWDPSPGAVEYVIYRSDAPGGQVTWWDWRRETAITHTALQYRPYYYRVAAKTETAESDKSAEVVALPVAGRPLAPEDVKVQAGNTQLTITWDPSDEATDYAIYRAVVYGNLHLAGSSAFARVGKTPYTAFTDQGLENGTRYSYAVTALSAAGESAFSRYYTGDDQPSAGALPAPEGLQAFPGKGQVTLRWKPVPGARLYSVHWGAPGGTVESAQWCNFNAAATVPSLVNSTSYVFAVQAWDGICGTAAWGLSAWSPLVAAQTRGSSYPAAPTGLQLWPGNSEMGVTWDADDSATEHRIYRAEAGGAFSLAGSSGDGPFLDEGVVDHRNYYYAVTALSPAGESTFSAQNYTSTPPTPIPPPAVRSLLMPMPGNGKVTLQWPPVPGATRYEVGWSQNPDRPDSTANVSGGPSYTRSGLVNGELWYHFVQACLHIYNPSCSPLSASVAATSLGALPLAPATLYGYAGNTQAVLRWNPSTSTGVTGYKVNRAAQQGGPYTLLTPSPVESAPFADQGLVNDARYWYVVTAVKSAGEGAFSEEVEVEPTARAPLAPTGLNAASQSAAVKLTWTASVGATSYNILRSTARGNTSPSYLYCGGYSTQCDRISTTTMGYTDSGLVNGTTYYYAVQACATWCGAISAEVPATPQ